MFLNEIDELIQSTKDLIDSEPIMVTLKREEPWVRTPAGGVVRTEGNPTEIEEQRMWLSGILEDARVVTRDQGEQVVCEHVLIGMPDADMKEKDYFSIGIRIFEIAELHPARDFQTKAWVFERASSGAS